MLADLAVPLLAALAFALLSPASPPSPEAPMPDPADPTDLGNLTDTPSPDPRPTDGPAPAPTGDPAPDPATPTDPGTPGPAPDPAPTPTGPAPDPAPTGPAPDPGGPTPAPAPGGPTPPADDGLVEGETLLTRRVAHGTARADIEKTLAELSERYDRIKTDVTRDDAAIAAMLQEFPDGMYHTDPDGKLGVYTKSTAEPGYYVVHPVPATTRVRNPDATATA